MKPGIQWESQFDSIYYFDEMGDSPLKDEIVLQSTDQILDYSIVVIDEKAKDYRLTKKYFCGCFEQSVHPA
ncbi:hypothetical protein BpHYR1_027454 [Brachionus plicatilis]|uniref:Uncharacterized protein n=1 Tax=Brachionus plicatilis TaxID=10195 RepID=A0A3M7PDX6_BRAPC|nr:hypothetical protein BpHYR1_027454 [Brachionus plicatilis]